MNLIFNNFTFFDYILLTITLLFIFFSFWKGFIQSILGLLTWVGSILIANYSWPWFANIITHQLYKISIFQKFGMVTNFFVMIISIPIIFLISLFILKKIRKIITSDIEAQIFGKIVDKFFGILYEVIFAYFIFSSMLFFSDKFESYIAPDVKWNLKSKMTNQSNILNRINETNHKFIDILMPQINIEN